MIRKGYIIYIYIDIDIDIDISLWWCAKMEVGGVCEVFQQQGVCAYSITFKFLHLLRVYECSSVDFVFQISLF